MVLAGTIKISSLVQELEAGGVHPHGWVIVRPECGPWLATAVFSIRMNLIDRTCSRKSSPVGCHTDACVGKGEYTWLTGRSFR